VVVVNEQFGRQFSGYGAAHGRRFSLGETSGEETEIVRHRARYQVLRSSGRSPGYYLCALAATTHLNGAMHFEVRTAA